MKRIVALIGVLAAFSASARLVSQPFFTVLGKEYKTLTGQNAINRFGNTVLTSLMGIDAYEYTGQTARKEVLAVAVDESAGKIECLVTREDKKGERKDIWSGVVDGGTPDFRFPAGVCIQPSDNFSNDHILYIYVADSDNDRVVRYKFYAWGNYGLTWDAQFATQLSCPMDVSFAKGSSTPGLLAVASTENNKVVFFKVSSGGSISYVTTYEESFNCPTSVVLKHITSNVFYLFTADSENNRVLRTELTFDGSSISFNETKILPVWGGVLYISASQGTDDYPEKVVYIHNPGRNLIFAYDWDFVDHLYTVWAYKPHDMAFNEGAGECVLAEQWTLNNGLKYYWLDSKFKEVGAIPNQFAAYSNQDVSISYIITGGGDVTVKVWEADEVWTGDPVATPQDGSPEKAGRHYAIWDATTAPPGDYVITFEVVDFYEGDTAYGNEIPITITGAQSGVSAFYSSFEPGEGSAVPYQNYILSNNCADNLWSGVVGAQNNIEPHYGDKMYKVTGIDTSSGTSGRRVEFLVFDSTSYEITEPTYLSYWVCAKEFPGGDEYGRIVFEGQIDNTKFRDWKDYGRFLDRGSRTPDPAEQGIPADGQWHQRIFVLNPASGEEIDKLFITFQEAPYSETGRFTVYFDDIQLTNIYPGGKYEWYPEHFANGTGPNHTNADCNFNMDFSAQNLGQETKQPCYPWIRLKVSGCGDYQGGSCCECLDADTVWISPSPGPGIIMDLAFGPVDEMIDSVMWPSGEVDSSTKISWWQYDRAHSLILGALVSEQYTGDTNWLYWAWNADNHWDETGYVHMGDSGHTRKYNEWEFIPDRNIRADYYSEYGAVAEYIHSLRVAHYCRSDWKGDKGGVIGDLYLGGDKRDIIDSVPPTPDPPRIATTPNPSPVFRNNWDFLRAPEGWEKWFTLRWSIGKGGRFKKASLYLSRDGGEIFEYEIVDSVPPGTEQPLDTIILDDTLVTVRYVLRGSYEWEVGAPPTTQAQIKLVVTDSSSNTYEYLSNLFEIYMPSGLIWPLEGNAPLVAVHPVMGETHLVWTTCGAEDTSSQDVSGSILYAHSFDGIKWDTLDSPVQGRRPAICLTSLGYPVIVYNDTAGGVHVSGHDLEGEWYSAGISPSSPIGADFTANPVMWLGDTMHFALFARMDTATEVLYAKEKYPILGGITNLYPLGIYLGEPEADYAPSIALDRDGLPHITYRMADTVYYAHFTGSAWVTDNFPSDTTCHPSVACVDGNVYILYRNPDKKLARKLGYLDGTLTSEQVVTATTGDILDPRLVGGSVVVFTDNEDTSARKVRFSQYDSEVNGFSYPVPITDVERNAYSPQGIFLSDTSLWLMWTEDRETHNKIAYLQLDPLYEIPCCELDAGWAQTPYTSHRDTTASYGAVTVDVGVDSLTYAYTEMDNSERHTVLLEFFFEDDSVQSTNYIVVCGTGVDTLEIEEGYVNQFFYGLSSGYSTIPVKVYATDSIPAQLARTVIYETQGGGPMGLAGVKGKVTPIPVRFALYQNAPNPFVSSTTIRYALPYACNVNLSVYDVSGRRVSVLHKGEQKAGLYTLQWNGKDDHNVGLAAGVYFIRFEADDYVESKKAVLLH